MSTLRSVYQRSAPAGDLTIQQLVEQFSVAAKFGRFYAFWGVLLALERAEVDLEAWKNSLPDQNITFCLSMMSLTAAILRSGAEKYLSYAPRFPINIIERSPRSFTKVEKNVDALLVQVYQRLESDLTGDRLTGKVFKELVDAVRDDEAKKTLSVLLLTNIATLVGVTLSGHTPPKQDTINQAKETLGQEALKHFWTTITSCFSQVSGQQLVSESESSFSESVSVAAMTSRVADMEAELDAKNKELDVMKQELQKRKEPDVVSIDDEDKEDQEEDDNKEPQTKTPSSRGRKGGKRPRQ